MRWFKALRSTGEKNRPGEFTVEDSEGVEWQVTAVESKMVPGTLTLLNEVVCMNRGYECGWDLRSDIQDAVGELIKAEADGDPQMRREAFVREMVSVCRRYRVMLEPDASEWDGLDIDEIVFSEFDSAKDITFHLSLGVVEEAIRQAVWPIIHPES